MISVTHSTQDARRPVLLSTNAPTNTSMVVVMVASRLAKNADNHRRDPAPTDYAAFTLPESDWAGALCKANFWHRFSRALMFWKYPDCVSLDP